MLDRGPRARSLYVIIGIGLPLLSIVLFVPFFRTCLWHLRNGTTTEFRGRSFSVPFLWTARSTAKTLFLERFSVSVLPKSPLLAGVALTPLETSSKQGSSPDDQCRSFSSVYWTLLAQKGDMVTGPIQSGVEGNRSCCMQAVPKAHNDWYHVTCLVFDGTWQLDFQGSAEDRQAVFDTMLGGEAAAWRTRSESPKNK